MTPLVSVAWLAHRLDDPAVRIADCRWYLGEPARGRAAYAAGHVPGAVYVDLERDLSAPDGPGRHPLPHPDRFAAALADKGIGSGHMVVAYDDRGGAVAARLWWMLRALDHDRAAVLDGGLTAWQAAGHPVSAEVPDHPPAELQLAGAYHGTWDRDAVRARLGDVVLVDARAAERYRGESEPIDPVAGHVPTAVNAPYEGNLTPDDTFLPAHELAARYNSLGVNEGREVAVYCGSGVTACHDLLALEVAGISGARLYPGSWSDWSTAGYPVAVGEGA